MPRQLVGNWVCGLTMHLVQEIDFCTVFLHGVNWCSVISSVMLFYWNMHLNAQRCFSLLNNIVECGQFWYETYTISANIVWTGMVFTLFMFIVRCTVRVAINQISKHQNSHVQCWHLIPALDACATRAWYTTARPIGTQSFWAWIQGYLTTERIFCKPRESLMCLAYFLTC